MPASNYTGNPTATQTPSAAPAPGVAPTKSIPAGTDALSIESITQDMKVDADFIGHIQSAARLDTAVVPAAGVGFTAPSYTGFGGTVAPSGSVKINTGTRFVIKIIAGGAVGTATFQTSTDGGNTFGATQTTAASMTDATSGITLAFSGGPFTANGTAAFRSAYTPRVQLQDASGNGRWLLDHNGFPTGGRTSQFREEWAYAAGPGSGLQIAWAGTPWTTDINASGATGGALALSAPSASYNARFLTLTPPTTLGSSTVLWGPQLFLANTAGQSVVMEFEFGMNAAAAGTASKTSYWVGLQDGTDDPSTDQNIVTLYKGYNQANWQTFTIVGAVPHTAATSTPPTAGTFPTDRFRIEIQGSASPYGAYQALFFVNEALIAVVAAASLPGAVALRPVFSAYTENGAPVGSPLAYVGPCLITWNRYASGPAL